MKIVILDRLTLGKDLDINIFNKLGDIEVYDTTNANEALKRVKNCDVVVTNKVLITEDIMKKSKFKLVCLTATGMNNVDLKAAEKLNIKIKNVAGYSTNSVVQTAFSIIFYFLQNLNYYKEYVEKGDWSRSSIFTCLEKPFDELNEKKVGVIGLGNIGKDFAKKISVFGCEVVYYSTSHKNIDKNYKRVELDELLKTSDIISIHCPLNEQTKNLLVYENMKNIKNKAILLNLGRGGIINEFDLSKIIDEKEIYCGLDVIEKEPIELNNPLMNIVNKQRLLITPHIGWASLKARKKMLELVVENIKSYYKS